jgi:hypothetical protein
VGSLRRVKSNYWTYLGWLLFCLTLGSCDDQDNSSQVETTPVPQGVDPFCMTRPKIDFCEDFDTSELPGSFDEQQTDLSLMTVDDTEASSIPQSLLIEVNSGGSGVLKNQFEAGGKLRLFGMLYVSELGEGEVKIGAFELGEYHIGFGVSADGSLWGYEGDQRIEGNGSIPMGRWASFRWDVNLYEDGTGNAKLRFGNDTIVDTDQLTPPAASDERPATTVGLFEATGPWTMRFDSVTVAVKEVVQ